MRKILQNFAEKKLHNDPDFNISSGYDSVIKSTQNHFNRIIGFRQNLNILSRSYQLRHLAQTNSLSLHKSQHSLYPPFFFFSLAFSIYFPISNVALSNCSIFKFGYNCFFLANLFFFEILSGNVDFNSSKIILLQLITPLFIPNGS